MASSHGVRRGYAEGPFGQMHYRIAGEGHGGRPPLVCFHMSPMSGRIYARFLGVMATDRVAIAPDTPGFGMSDAPDAPPGIADYARAMAALIERLVPEGPVDLIGYHTGSKIAAELAATWGPRVRRIIMVSAPIFTDADRAEFRAHYAAKAPREDGSHLAERWQGYRKWHRGMGQTLEDVADMFPEALLGRAIDWWGHRAAFDYAPDMRLPEIGQPVLVLNPGDDLVDYTRRAEPLLANGRMIDLPAWGHGFLDRRTDEAAALVRSFLDAPDARPFDAIAVPASAA